MSNETQRYLHDYVWMKLPAGEPEKVPAEQISQKMWAGYAQCEPPAEGGK